MTNIILKAVETSEGAGLVVLAAALLVVAGAILINAILRD
jgi:hypothetical protein